MGASGGFPVDLILFGMIAAFLVLRLRSILGRRTGFERPTQSYQPPAGQTSAPFSSTREVSSGSSILRPGDHRWARSCMSGI